MAGDLFQDLPPPTVPPTHHSSTVSSSENPSHKPPPPPPALKSALKRPKPPPESQPEVLLACQAEANLAGATASPRMREKLETLCDFRKSEFYVGCMIMTVVSEPRNVMKGKGDGRVAIFEVSAAPEKRLRFKTTTDASEKQVIDAMQKIASHIRNPSKFCKASKLTIQLIQAGSVKPATSNHFFAILEGAMSMLSNCNDPSLRADYHALFSAAQDATDCLSKKQHNMLNSWTIRAVWANDLLTDDSFVFSKATGRIRDAISSLPVATEDDDMEEAITLKEEPELVNVDEKRNEVSPHATSEQHEEELDPFGLDQLITSAPKKDEKSKGKIEPLTRSKKDDEEENKRFLKSQREALISCVEIAAKRYKTPWCQTSIDILSKHTFDNISRFTTRQRRAIEKLWASIREQQTLRKQGKSVSGKLDVNAFEWLQQKYANEKISIRHSVGGSGDRRAQQWLG